MKLDIIGDRRRPKILLIHPSVADSRCFAPLFPYLEDYCLILPTLGGHDITSSDDYRGGACRSAGAVSSADCEWHFSAPCAVRRIVGLRCWLGTLTDAEAEDSQDRF